MINKCMFYYIGHDIKKIQTGGDAVNIRNIKILKEIFNNKFRLINISYDSRIYTFINLLLGYMNGLSLFKVIKIINDIPKEKDSNIFLSSSKLGKLAYFLKLKNKNFKVWIFFHNIEKQYCEEEYRVNKTLKNWLISKVTSYNEKLACKYGDFFIVLNQRDEQLLQKYYSHKAHIILPTTFEDKYEEKRERKIIKDTYKFNLLFVGSAFFANIEGMNWFITNVFPYLSSCCLTIVGNNMDKHFKSTENIKVYGYVDDLSLFYYNCDVVISPIFSGGGMKTKTAEALMYGCPIIGTKETFEGYDFLFEKVGACCNNDYDMIKAIRYFQNNTEKLQECALSARNIYKETYTLDASKNKILEFLHKK